MIERKPDTYTRRFIEWSHSHGCPILMKYDNETEWKQLKTKYFNWGSANYKIDNETHRIYYERLYTHGQN